MKALVKLKPKRGLSLEDVSKPSISDTEVLIKIKTTSLCGTDLHIYEWDDWAKKTLRLPLIIGHEFVGEIVEVGKDVSHFKVGDRVSGEGHITCGECRLCRSAKRHLCPRTKGLGIQRNGAFAEYLSLPESNVIKVPTNIPQDIAAILDPLGNAVHTVLATDIISEDALITGSGPIGLMTLALLKHLGAKTIVITDINEYRLKLAEKMQATHAVNVKQTSLKEIMPSLSLEDGFTVGFEMSGQESAIQSQMEMLAPGATLASLGLASGNICIDWNQLILKGLKFKGIYGRKMFETWAKMFNLLESGLDVSPVITHRFKAEEYEKAFELDREGLAGKILLEW